MTTNSYDKYLKYKNKYLQLKAKLEGGKCNCKDIEIIVKTPPRDSSRDTIFDYIIVHNKKTGVERVVAEYENDVIFNEQKDKNGNVFMDEFNATQFKKLEDEIIWEVTGSTSVLDNKLGHYKFKFDKKNSGDIKGFIKGYKAIYNCTECE